MALKRRVVGALCVCVIGLAATTGADGAGKVTTVGSSGLVRGIERRVPTATIAALRVAPRTTDGTSVTTIDNPDAYVCSQTGYIDFESLPDGTNLSETTFNAIHLTTTDGYTWLVGDFSTGQYNGKYPSGDYTSQGTHWAWLGPDEGHGRIDLENPASVFSLLVSSQTPIYLDAYNASDELIATAGPSDANVGTGTMAELKITRSTRDIAYVVVHDSGNYFLVDSVCSDAPGLPASPQLVGWAPGGNVHDPASQVSADNANIHKPGECAANSALLFRVRGSSEHPGTDFLGAWTAAAGNALIADGWRVRDMQADYPAPGLPLTQIALALVSRNPIAVAAALLSLKHYRDQVTATWQNVRNAIIKAYDNCPLREIALSGYSLGGIMLRYVVPNLPARVRAKIARIDLVADPTGQGSIDSGLMHSGGFSARRTDEGIDTWAARKVNPVFKQTHYPADVDKITYQYCLPFDVVCETNPVNLSPVALAGESGRHRSYQVTQIGKAAANSVDSHRSW